MDLSAPATALPFVGSAFAAKFKRLGIVTTSHLLHHYPVRYVDYSRVCPISKLKAGETATVLGTIAEFNQKYTRKKNFTIQEAILADQTGKLKITWFNQPYLTRSIAIGDPLAVASIATSDTRGIVFENPEYEVLKNAPLIHTGRLVPIYPETKGVSSKWLRNKIALLTGLLPLWNNQYNVMASLKEWLPPDCLTPEGLMALPQAIAAIHFPENFAVAEAAKKRLGFEELLLMQLTGLTRKQQWGATHRSIQITSTSAALNRLLTKLPFSLTQDQHQAINEILTDLAKPTAMNRLLVGDVGSGKTVVAAAAAYTAIKSGYQAAFMAPTQVLADQHAQTLTELLQPLGVRVALLTGATKNQKLQIQNTQKTQRIRGSDVLRESEDQRKAIKPSYSEFSEYPDLIIGTHALIHHRALKVIDPSRLALVIIDEQHRFGVSQRSRLTAAGSSPHVLSMTATPIPRTIALTYMADLNVSLIKQMPPGRLPVKTWVVPESKRLDAYQWVATKLRQGQQAFVICPLIEGSESETLSSVKSAEQEYEKMKLIFSEFKVALLHGRMKPAVKTQTLQSMKQGGVDILVSTAVVEVGVDIPRATIMIIEGSERFGLAQLHQLRGRVGRRQEPAGCLLFCTNWASAVRLKPLTSITSGLELAQLDLKLRGPGDIYSTLQHGWPQLKIANLADISYVQHVFRVAQQLLESPRHKSAILKKIQFLVDNPVAAN